MLGSSEISESGVKVSSRILQRYVLRGEQVEVATRQHWASLTEPVLTVLVSFVFISWVSGGLERAFGEFGLYLWWVWFALVVRLLWNMLEWRNEWFVATDKRLLLTYGLITHKVAMMPLGKVTDMTYGRSITGRFVGYGTFVLESAGQDQALQKINWVPDPDETYREICDIIFGPERRFDSDDSLPHAQRDDSGSPGQSFDDVAAESEPPDYPDEGYADEEYADQHDPFEGFGRDSGWDDEAPGESSSDDASPTEAAQVDHDADHHGVEDADADAGWQTSSESATTYIEVRPRAGRD
ncbi:MAG: PH domain-containing protein [Ornithinimicrobium sp.]